MTILEKLNSRERFKFENSDTDSWEYNGEELTQYISGQLTEGRLTVHSLTEEVLIVRWPDNTTTTFNKEQIYWE